MKNRNIIWNLIILFELIFITKILINFGADGTYIYPDEACISQRARHFISTFQITPCRDIINFPAVDPMPLYSILISPVYLFFKGGSSAYQAILALNSLFISSLVFPLYFILRDFIKKTPYLFLAITITLFTPVFSIYEKSYMTENAYNLVFVWFLFFYYQSFKVKKLKIPAYILAILGTFTRPFGFILPLALISSDIVTSKYKKLAAILIPITLVGFISFVHFAEYINFAAIYAKKILPLATIEGLQNYSLAAVKQMNSLTIGSSFIPLICLFLCLFNKKFPKINKLSTFVFIYLFFNLGISGQHIFGYINSSTPLDPNLLTRYIQSSIILTYIIALAYLGKSKDIKFTKKRTLFMSLWLIPLVFVNGDTVKQTLNPELSYLFTDRVTSTRDLIDIIPYFGTISVAVAIICVLAFIQNKKKIVTYLAAIMIVPQSILVTLFSINSIYTQEYVNFFTKIEDQYTITFINTANLNALKAPMMNLLAETHHKVGVFATSLDTSISITQSQINNDEKLKNSDIIISKHTIEDGHILFKLLLGGGDDNNTPYTVYLQNTEDINKMKEIIE